MSENDNDNDNWLTAKEAADKYGLDLRRVYRWARTGKVNQRGVKGNTQLNDSSIKEQVEKLKRRDVVNQVITASANETDKKPNKREMSNVVGGTILDVTRQRDYLQRQLEETSQARVKDVERLGNLEGQLSVMERLNRLLFRLLVTVAIIAMLLLAVVVLLALFK